MIVLLSPAKRMKFDGDYPALDFSIPQFHDMALPIINKLSKFSKPALMRLMSISKDLALLNQERYNSFSSDPNNGQLSPAIFTFNGEVYWGLEAETLDKKDLSFANSHVRILSGLYGYLRPLDLIQPYRLEMGSKLPIGRKKNLYEYWQSRIAEAVNEDLNRLDSDLIINLASKEYAQVVNPDLVNARILTINFKEFRNNQLKSIQFNLKRARGSLTRFISQNKITTSEDLKAFNTDGYSFSDDHSNTDHWIFIK